MSVIDSADTFITPSESVCPNCADLFEYRSNKTYCSPKCRKAHNKTLLREGKQGGINNALHSEIRQNMELLHLNAVLCEKVYTMAPADRYGYVENILQIALANHGGLLRHLLCNKKYQYPDPTNRKLFFRGAPKSYKTFPQMCNHYLLNSPWNCYLSDFLKGKAPPPSTGEVYADGTIDIRIGAEGWKSPVAGHRHKGGKIKRYVKGPVIDPLGHYENPWYLDGATHRKGAKAAVRGKSVAN